MVKYVMRCAIWYYLYNLKNVKNTHGGVLILVKLQAEASRFLNCINGTESRNAPHMPVFTVFSVSILNLYKPGLIKPSRAIGLFLYTLKASENLWFSDIFRRYRKKLVAWNGLVVNKWVTDVMRNLMFIKLFVKKCAENNKMSWQCEKLSVLN